MSLRPLCSYENWMLFFKANSEVGARSRMINVGTWFGICFVQIRHRLIFNSKRLFELSCWQDNQSEVCCVAQRMVPLQHSTRGFGASARTGSMWVGLERHRFENCEKCFLEPWLWQRWTSDKWLCRTEDWNCENIQVLFGVFGFTKPSKNWKLGGTVLTPTWITFTRLSAIPQQVSAGTFLDFSLNSLSVKMLHWILSSIQDSRCSFCQSEVRSLCATLWLLAPVSHLFVLSNFDKPGCRFVKHWEDCVKLIGLICVSCRQRAGSHHLTLSSNNHNKNWLFMEQVQINSMCAFFFAGCYLHPWAW